ncbi:MAG TPA: class II aldolase/adducin family protein [Trebonia sp.]|jgi:ribulose-5-phosphate 4-epimerase/fuculose-1-phosphate aldolase|nr:class II aldolase/adducin family protein [Trebonia sp.]
MSGAPADLRAELATATRILARHGLVGMFGHVSVLTEDPRRYLICPGAGARKDRCRPEDVLELDLDHDFEPGLPLELYMHSEVHRLKPHVKSLIHVHSPALVALAAMAEVPGELLMMHASFWPAAMPLWEEPDLVRDRAAARRLTGILGEEAIALLRWHGAVIAGRTLHEAVFRAILAEEHAAQLVTALSHGRPLFPVPRSVDRDELYAKVLSPRTHDMHWDWAASFADLPPDAHGPV